MGRSLSLRTTASLFLWLVGLSCVATTTHANPTENLTHVELCERFNESAYDCYLNHTDTETRRCLYVGEACRPATTANCSLFTDEPVYCEALPQCLYVTTPSNACVEPLYDTAFTSSLCNSSLNAWDCVNSSGLGCQWWPQQQLCVRRLSVLCPQLTEMAQCEGVVGCLWDVREVACFGLSESGVNCLEQSETECNATLDCLFNSTNELCYPREYPPSLLPADDLGWQASCQTRYETDLETTCDALDTLECHTRCGSTLSQEHCSAYALDTNATEAEYGCDVAPGFGFCHRQTQTDCDGVWGSACEWDDFASLCVQRTEPVVITYDSNGDGFFVSGTLGIASLGAFVFGHLLFYFPPR